MPRETTTIELPAPTATPKPKAKAASKPKAKATKATAKKATASKPKRGAKIGWTETRSQEQITPILGLKDAPTGYHLMAIAHKYATTLANVLYDAPGGARLTVPQLQTLHLLAANKDAYGAELARAMGVQPQTVTSITVALREKGLITDLLVTKGQGRANLMTLTDQGRKALTAARKAAKSVDALLTSAYSHDGVEERVLVDMIGLGHRALARRLR